MVSDETCLYSRSGAFLLSRKRRRVTGKHAVAAALSRKTGAEEPWVSLDPLPNHLVGRFKWKSRLHLTFENKCSDPTRHQADATGTVYLEVENVFPNDGADGNTYTVQVDEVTNEFPTLSLSSSNGQTVEGSSGNTVVTFTATLSNASAQQVTVSYEAAGMSAQTGVDFLASSGSLAFSPGTTQKTFDLEIVGDTEVEPDETFRVILRDVQGAVRDQAGDFDLLHTIIDDDEFDAILQSEMTLVGQMEPSLGGSYPFIEIV